MGSDRPAWILIWLVTGMSGVIAVTMPDMRREALALVAANSTAAFALIKNRDD